MRLLLPFPGGSREIRGALGGSFAAGTERCPEEEEEEALRV